MKSKIKITDSAGGCVIDIEGVIGTPEQMQFDEGSSSVATYARLRREVEQIAAIEAPEVTVNIRSCGGDVQDALLIYDALAGLDARIVTRCYGYTASAATIIAQAASEGCREISANALYLIHNSMCSVEGNAGELETRAELLRKTDGRIAALYAARSGRDVQQFADLMGENGGQGRWLSPEEALAAGLVDRIAAPEERRADALVRDVARKVAAWFGFGPKAADGQADAAAGQTDAADAAAEAAVGAAAAVAVSDSAPNGRTEQSLIAFGEGQRSVGASATRPCEDPTDDEGCCHSANALAYSADARCIRKI